MYKNNRIIYLDILRIVSICAVAIIHSTDSLKFRFGQISDEWWWIGNFYHTISSLWAVPILIMVSGALLLDQKKEDSIGSFLKKRLSKVVIPFIFWGIIYSIWKYRQDISIGNLPWENTIKDFIVGSVYYHMWFIYVILGLYLITPILKVYLNNASDDNIKYLLTIWFISYGVIDLITGLTGIKLGVDMRYFSGFIGYYILGYYLNKIKFDKNPVTLYVIIVACIVTAMIGNFILIRNTGVFNHAISASSPISIIVPISIFILIKNIKWDSILKNDSRLYKLVSEISMLSFGIYLVHALILDVLRIYGVDVILFNPILSVPIIATIVILISYAIIKLMTKLPIVNMMI